SERAERYHDVPSIVMPPLRTLSLLAATIVLAGAAPPQPKVPKEKPAPMAWKQTAGPYGALVRSVGFTPSGELLVGTETGSVYRSSADGTWTATPLGELNEAASKPGGLLYAATEGNGVCRSRDDGVTWALGEKGLAAHSLALLPDGGVLAGVHDGLVKSVDGGA